MIFSVIAWTLTIVAFGAGGLAPAVVVYLVAAIIKSYLWPREA